MTDHTKLVERFWSKLGESPVVMLSLPHQPAHSEPMTAMFDHPFPDTLYFYTRTDNRLVQGLADAGPRAMAHFSAKGHDFFASLAGSLSTCGYSKMVDYFWSEEVAAWYDGGQADSRLEMLRFHVAHVEMWQADPEQRGTWRRLFGGGLDLDTEVQSRPSAVGF